MSLTADELVLRYDDRVVVDGLDVALPPGRITAIVGPNACGKSTLLRGLGRIIAPAAGHVDLDGTDLREIPGRELARRLGLLPQSPVAPDGITVADLVERGRSPHQGWFGGRGSGDDAAVARAMRATGVLDLAARPVDELSGGQRQRVWIAMVLAQDTGVLLLDEPTTFLDMTHAVEVLDLLVDRNRAEATTVAVVLHDLNLACRYADHVVAMRDGAIVDQGPPATVMTEDLVRRVFAMESRVVPDPVSGTPMVVPAGRHHPVRAQAGPTPAAPGTVPAAPDPAPVGTAPDEADAAGETVDRVREEAELREVVPEPHPMVWAKAADHLDPVAASFVDAAPLLFLGTAGPTGAITVSPRGNSPGDGARILDGGRRVALPERSGNRRLDSMRNLLDRSGAGLVFCIPQVLHVLRINGHGRVVRDPDVLGLWPDPPDLAIVVDVEETYVHCGRALKSSGIWDPEQWADPRDVPGLKTLADAARATRP